MNVGYLIKVLQKYDTNLPVFFRTLDNDFGIGLWEPLIEKMEIEDTPYTTKLVDALIICSDEPGD